MSRPLSTVENVSRTCRICLDNDNLKDLISPCLCSGGSAFVHRKCLDEWRSSNKQRRAFTHCDVCQFKYVIEPVADDPSADRRRLIIFRLLVARDIISIILIIQAFLVGLTFLLKFLDKDKHAIKDLYPISMGSFGVYYLSSIILFLALLGVIGLMMACCGMLNDRNTNDDDCCCYSSYCMCVGCDNGDCGSSGNDGEGLMVCCIIVIIFFAIIGIFVGIVFSVTIAKIIIERHTKKLWLRQETKKYVVKDFHGRRHELQNVSAQHHTRALSTQPKDSHINTKETTSKPIELLPVTTV